MKSKEQIDRDRPGEKANTSLFAITGSRQPKRELVGEIGSLIPVG
jgi:hypothetical protein